MEGNVGSGYLGSRYIDEHLPRMPVLGLGTAGLGGSGYSIVCHALRSGMYRLIDTAQAREWYDETSVGKALRDCGGQNISNTIVVTKIHPRDYE
jgi:diketogulonate reductase-like aldo/keto reductase